MKKVTKFFLIGLIVLGFAIIVINFTTPNLRAGYVEKVGTFPGDRLACPGDPTNCTHRIYVEENDP